MNEAVKQYYIDGFLTDKGKKGEPIQWWGNIVFNRMNPGTPITFVSELYILAQEVLNEQEQK